MQPPRIIDVRPPSAWAELTQVLRAAALVVLASSLAIAVGRQRAPERSGGLLPSQRLFAQLDGRDQRMVRSLREAMSEAEVARARDHRWPAVEALAASGIPPFSDALDRDGYAWRRAEHGLAVDYLGTPRPDSGRAAFLLQFLEPDPTALRAPGERPPPRDEQHHTLSDGTALHVGTWTRPCCPAPGAAPQSPALEGWTQLLSKPLDLSAAAPSPSAQAGAGPLRVGVTLHPTFSWVKSVALGLPIEVRAVLPAEIDAGNYQPSPEDVRKLADLDAIVVNALGHDDFIEAMIAASGNRGLVRIRANDDTPLLGSRDGAVNSHTFLSFTNAIQQSYFIARALGELRPELAPRLEQNASAYAERLRGIRNAAAARLAHAKQKRVVTVHDGYRYLLQEFGLELAGVVEPAHGLVPSATELREMIDLIRRERIQVVLTEETFPKPLLDVLRAETGARVYLISHVAVGTYSAEEFEQVMEQNARTLVRALVQDG